MKKFYKILVITIIITLAAVPAYDWYHKHPDREYRVRSYDYLLNRYILQKNYLIADSIYGTKFKFNIKDAVGKSIYKVKNYEPWLTNFVLKKITYKPQDVILDVGANLGRYSINLSKINPNISIFAFEPDDANFMLLNNNMTLNNTTNVIAINKAVTERQEGKMVLYKYPDKNLGRHSLLKTVEVQQQQILVDTVSIDDFIFTKHLNGKNIKLLKIDVEGYEYQVLLGCVNTLTNVSYILHEFSPNIMKKNNIVPDKLLYLLLEHNFEPFTIDNNSNLKPITLQEIRALSDGANLLWKNRKLVNFD